MKQQSDVNKRVEETLNSLDGIQRAAAQPWLFARVKGRLLQQEDKTGWGRVSSFLARPAVAIAGLLIILALNGLVVINQADGNSIAGNAVDMPNDSESLIASSSSFDYENLVQP